MMASAFDPRGRLFTIAYSSHMTRQFSEADLHAMCASFVDKNRTGDLTGVMFTIGEHFFQVLEGPERQVKETFEKISGDRRHQNIVELVDQPVSGRAFPDWSMRVITLAPIEQSIVLGALKQRRSEGPYGEPLGLPAGLTARQLGATIGGAIGVTMESWEATEPLRLLLYAIETVWANPDADPSAPPPVGFPHVV
jgi:hypothetical protein